jgi:hypothetical protein
MKKIIGTISLLLYINLLSAQTQYSSEWSIHAGAGNATLQYDLPESMLSSGIGNVNVKSGIGGNLGVRYAYFFSPYLGFSLGLEASLYNSSLTIDNLNFEHPIETPPGLAGAFFLRTNYSGMEETQTAYLIQLPLMLQFQVPLGRSAFFYLGAGGKLGIPVSASYNQTIRSVTTTGYSDYTAQIYQDMPNHGFSARYNIRSSDKLALKTSSMLSFETGFKWKITEKNALYTGIYLDYGMNNIQKESSGNLLEYNNINPTDYKYNSILQTAVDNTALVEKISSYAWGIKIGIAFGSGKKISPSGSKPKASKPMPLLGY